jgi:hypothetical protein
MTLDEPPQSNDEPLTRQEWLRRVVITSTIFARNLAYFRVGKETEFADLLDRRGDSSTDFWIAANSNCLDFCVLEWCKLLGDERGRHYWGAIVADPSAFQSALLDHLEMDEPALREYIRGMRHYRDKFVAHLDSDRAMVPPLLDVAKKSVWFYHAHIVEREASQGDLNGLILDLTAFYRSREIVARSVFRKALT